MNARQRRAIVFALLAACLTFTACSIAPHADTEVSTSMLNGAWTSAEWEYGFRIEGTTGYATHWRNTYNPDDTTGAGDVVLRLDRVSGRTFSGRQLFYDGSWVAIEGQLRDHNTIRLEGRNEIWIMTRDTDIER